MAKLAKMHALILVVFLPACANWAEWPHENFKHNYGGQVGRRADDPSTLIARYPEDVIGQRTLPNGNKEIELLHTVSRVDGTKCVVFYEVDSKTNVIVAWRYEGDEKVCYWAP